MMPVIVFVLHFLTAYEYSRVRGFQVIIIDRVYIIFCWFFLKLFDLTLILPFPLVWRSKLIEFAYNFILSGVNTWDIRDSRYSGQLIFWTVDTRDSQCLGQYVSGPNRILINTVPFWTQLDHICFVFFSCIKKILLWLTNDRTKRQCKDDNKYGKIKIWFN